MKFPLYPGLRKGRGLLCALLLASPAAFGQSEAATARSETPPDVVTKIDRLTKSLEQTQVELAESRTEIQQLRAALEEVLSRMNTIAPLPAAAQQPGNDPGVPQAGGSPTPSQEAHGGTAQISQDDWDILNARV